MKNSITSQNENNFKIKSFNEYKSDQNQQISNRKEDIITIDCSSTLAATAQNHFVQNYEGGENNQNYQLDGPDGEQQRIENRPGNQEEQEHAKSVKKVTKPKKIQRYESASLDEEEFQDYFTNPIKRKEFDRQRKKQQMKEMQNITGFTLGQFGIKNMKALREALPAYPDDEEGPIQNDSQKNYATVALCCLSVTNPFRNRVIQMVTVNPCFDRLILFVIMLNCLVLATDKEVDFVTENVETIDLVFLIIYTCEMVLKIIAMGFIMREHSYLRDSWNKLDFVVVVMGWVSQFLSSGDISAIKVIRILRPLRTINQIPNMSSLVATILNSLPIMFEVMVLFGFMLIMFGTIATQLLGGHLQKRCMSFDPVLRNVTHLLGDDQVEVICMNQEQCDAAKIKFNIIDFEVKCQLFENPIQGTYSFDNILLSIMNIFQIITLEGWTDMMYLVREAEGTYTYDFFFLCCVIFGSFVILNLMIAVQASYLDTAFDEEDARQQEILEKAERKRKLREQIAAEDGIEDIDEDEGDFEEDIENLDFPDQNAETSQRERVQTKRKKKKEKGCCNFKPPQIFLSISEWLHVIISSPYFERTVIVLIILNTMFLASEFYEQPDWLTMLQDIGNLFFTIIFLVELLIKLIALGFQEYSKDGFNLFDAFIVIMSYVELFMPGENSSLSVLRAFRLLRIFKIIKSWDSLRILLSTVLESLTSITNLAVLILLYLFISALLTKQFFSDPLLDGDGNLSRYSFQSTGYALVSMFIILSGENWNEIMVQVIDQQGSMLPALLFSFIFILGNFMLLNLFLAILLKSISNIGAEDSEDQEDTNIEVKVNEQTNQIEDQNQPSVIKDEIVDDGVSQSLKKSQNTYQNNVDASGSQNENDINHTIKVEDEMNLDDSNIINSSNSNIEEEFAQIKNQLMALSKNMNNIMDKDKPENQEDEHKNDKKDEKKESTRSKENSISLFIFKYDNPIRSFARQVVSSQYFAGFIYTLIALNSLLLALDEPQLQDSYQKKTIALLLTTISIIFVFEFVIKVVVSGFYWCEKAYLHDSWNILDFIIVCFSFLTWILEAYAGTNVEFVRGFRALRALRPLRVVSKNEGIKTVVNSLLESIPALLNVLLIVLLFLMVFGILGIQLFKGKMGKCNDEDTQIKNKGECKGTYNVIVRENFKEVQQLQEREWIVSINNYDTITQSMMTFFEISTLEMWPGMMYEAIDSVGLDQSPVINNAPATSLVFVIYIFVTTFFIMNLFISVIVDKFNEQIKKRQGADNFSNEQKEWVKIQRLLLQTNPKIIPVEPINCFRMQCFKIVQSQAFEYFVMTAIVINTLFLCIDHYGIEDDLETILNQSNQVFVVFFTLEMILKMTAYGLTYYWYVNWNKFDFIVVMFSLIALDEALLTQMNFNVTALRIIRVSRLLRMVKTSEGLRTLLKTLFMSMGNIINTALLLGLVLFTFTVAGMSLFGTVQDDGEFIDENVNFRGFYISIMTLWRASTGESWNGIMHSCTRASGIISVFFWVIYQLMTFFIFMNVFIAVIGESFNDNQATEDENDILALKKKDIKAFQNTWAKYNPMGELFMKTDRLPNFLKDLPPPLGYQGIRIEDSKLNKIIFCLNIRDHEGKVYYPEVMWTIFHSIAGMNDDKVLACDQIVNILKEVRLKYKALGKKVNLDSLCGNKFYRKELTAIKYIQAKKILEKWRELKSIKAKNAASAQAFGGQIQDQEKNQDRPNNNQNLVHGRAKIYEASQEEVTNIKQTRIQNIQAQIQNNRKEEQAPSLPDANREEVLQNDPSYLDGDSAEMDLPMTERNPMSSRYRTTQMNATSNKNVRGVNDNARIHRGRPSRR